MNYLKLYINIIRKAKNRLGLEGYIENHHIFPISIFGKNDKIVKLTAREHFIVHWLLVKIFLKRYGNCNKTYKMICGFLMMCNSPCNKRYYSRSYQYARKHYSDIITGKKRPELNGKAYFGASKEKILLGIQKMVQKKTGMKIENYPKNRKSSPRIQVAHKISETKKKTKQKYIKMTKEQFLNWIKKHDIICEDGRINSNITRAIIWRGEKLKDYGIQTRKHNDK